MDLGSTVEAFFQDEVDRAFRDEGLSPGTSGRALPGPAAGRLRRPADREHAARAAHAGGGGRAAARAAPAAARHRRHVALRLGVLERAAWTDALVDVDYYIEMGGTAYGELARGGTGLDRRSVRRRVRRAGGELRPLRRRAGADQPARRHADQQPGHPAALPALAADARALDAAARLAALGVVPPKGDGRLQ